MLNNVKFSEPLKVATWSKQIPTPEIRKAPIYDVKAFLPTYEKAPYKMERKPLAVKTAEKVKRSITREREPLEIQKGPIATTTENKIDSINILGRNFKTSYLFLGIAGLTLYYTIKNDKKKKRK
jgi:hypothetical protein